MNNEMNSTDVDLINELEALELRLFEAIWSIERVVTDELALIRKIHADLDWIKDLLVSKKFGHQDKGGFL